jgi:putative endonuclease
MLRTCGRSRSDVALANGSPEDATCFVYVLGSWRDGVGRTYVGWTTNIDNRLKQHNSGRGAKSTRGRQWVLLHAEAYASRHEAMSREWHLKRDRTFRAALRQP